MKALITAILLTAVVAAVSCEQETTTLLAEPATTETSTSAAETKLGTSEPANAGNMAQPAADHGHSEQGEHGNGSTTAEPAMAATMMPAPETMAEPKPEVMAEPTAEPTVTRMMAHSPADAMAMSLYNKLSEEERECLGSEVTSDKQIIMMAADETTMGQQGVMRCLSQDNRFELYMAVSADDDNTLSVETHRCIWDSTHSIIADYGMQAEQEPATEHAMAMMGKVMVMMVMVPVYCVASHQPDLESPDYDLDQRQMEALGCTIDLAGGPAEWSRLLLSDEGRFEEIMMQAEAECGFEGMDAMAPLSSQ